MENGFTMFQPPFGHVRYIDHLGSDRRIVEAARVSYKMPSKGEDQDKKLLFYLYKMRHTSPFEQCNITFNIKLPIFLMRQFVRHRTFRLNEWSGRYSELGDDFFVPRIWRKQDTKNKQAGIDPFSKEANTVIQRKVENIHRVTYQCYQELLEMRVAKELARIVLPVSTYTEIYVNCDLHNLIHFLRLRLDSHAQLEIQEIAAAMLVIATELFPWTFEAFNKFKMEMIEQP